MAITVSFPMSPSGLHTHDGSLPTLHSNKNDRAIVISLLLHAVLKHYGLASDRIMFGVWQILRPQRNRRG